MMVVVKVFSKTFMRKSALHQMFIWPSYIHVHKHS